MIKKKKKKKSNQWNITIKIVNSLTLKRQQLVLKTISDIALMCVSIKYLQLNWKELALLRIINKFIDKI